MLQWSQWFLLWVFEIFWINSKLLHSVWQRVASNTTSTHWFRICIAIFSFTFENESDLICDEHLLLSSISLFAALALKYTRGAVLNYFERMCKQYDLFEWHSNTHKKIRCIVCASYCYFVVAVIIDSIYWLKWAINLLVKRQ